VESGEWRIENGKWKTICFLKNIEIVISYVRPIYRQSGLESGAHTYCP
jgi:hypothetical protein